MAASFISEKAKAFMGKRGPPGYIPGVGRGATGFTTRSDIGPAKDPSEMTTEGVPDVRDKDDKTKDKDREKETRKPDSDNEDDSGLFAGGPYDADDAEADQVYAAVDKKMDERRKARREAQEREELKKLREARPKIQQQFADLKRDLATVTADEWAAIPDIGDRSIKKQKRPERFTPAPDSLFDKARQEAEYTNKLDPRQQALGGLETPAGGMATPLADLKQIGEARGTVLGVKLDQMADSVTGQTVVDPKGYLTDLNSIVLKSDAEIGDIKKARLLLKSVTSTNPKHAPGWIAAARVEEVAGKLAAARQIIAQGCEECPQSPDVWLEAARLNTPENAKIILGTAIQHLQHSVKIWLQAAELETDVKARKRVLRRALEFIPNSYKLWKAAVQLEEDSEDARVMLTRAVECIPDSVDLWLALARLESYEKARKVLNEARKACPGSHEIWITAAQLEEANQNHAMVDVIIQRAVDTLTKAGVDIKRDQWIKEAEDCEKSGYVTTCQAIARHTIGLGVDEEDRKDTWMEDAESSLARGAVQTARAIYAHALQVFPMKPMIWTRAAFLEKNHGTRYGLCVARTFINTPLCGSCGTRPSHFFSESLEELLQRAVRYCPQAETLWLMGAKEKWLAGDVEGARTVLKEAFKSINSESIWLAAVKLESENGEYERARLLLAKARDNVGSERVWLKSAVLDRQLGRLNDARQLLDAARQKFPAYAKLWMVSGQIEESAGDSARARELYTEGLKHCATSVPLWILSARLEEKTGAVTKARAILEKARLKNPNTELLWLEAIRLENRANNGNMARSLLAKALQEVPKSGILWAESIFMEPRPQRKSRSVDALKKCDNDANVVLAVARLFWADRIVEKARNWFNRAVKLDPDNGDAWAYFLKFEIEQGTDESRQDVITRTVQAEPRHGLVWPTVAKAVGNARKTPEEILALTAAALDNA